MVALETFQEGWTIEKGGGRGSERSTLAAWHNDDDDDKEIDAFFFHRLSVWTAGDHFFQSRKGGSLTVTSFFLLFDYNEFWELYNFMFWIRLKKVSFSRWVFVYCFACSLLVCLFLFCFVYSPCSVATMECNFSWDFINGDTHSPCRGIQAPYNFRTQNLLP